MDPSDQHFEKEKVYSQHRRKWRGSHKKINLHKILLGTLINNQRIFSLMKYI